MHALLTNVVTVAHAVAPRSAELEHLARMLRVADSVLMGSMLSEAELLANAESVVESHARLRGASASSRFCRTEAVVATCKNFMQQPQNASPSEAIATSSREAPGQQSGTATRTREFTCLAPIGSGQRRTA